MKKSMIMLITLSIVLLSGCGFYDSVFNDTIKDTDYEIETHVYKEVYGEEIELDIVYPLNSSYEELPVLVYVHGGGYKGGDKSAAYSKGFFWYLNKTFLDNGYALVSINYTLADQELGTSMEDCFIDSKDAIRWLHKNEQELGIDSDNIGLFGTSAGGGIVTMLSTTSNDVFIGDTTLSAYPSDINYAINLYGGDARLIDEEIKDLQSYDDLPSEISSLLDSEGFIVGHSINDSFTSLQTQVNMLNSLTYLDALDTPIISFHGTEDPTVDIDSSIMLHEQLDLLGIDNELFQIDGAGHSLMSSVITDEDRIQYVNEAFEFASEYYKH